MATKKTQRHYSFEEYKKTFFQEEDRSKTEQTKDPYELGRQIARDVHDRAVSEGIGLYEP